VFTPAHINHSSTRWNVVSKPTPQRSALVRGHGIECLRTLPVRPLPVQVAGGVGQTVSFYACRHISTGEELLLNYGRRYWQRRKDEEMP